MSIRHLFPIALALIACFAATAPAAMAQTAPGLATKPPAAPNPALMHPMVFYPAHGEADACGPGCSEWIAAEGKIDRSSADRLQHLLAQLKGARPPLFFDSPGGLVTGSISLGEIIRARKLTVSVGHTAPLNCDGGSKNPNPCDAEIRTGRPIEAKLDLLAAMCNSGCVYALAGGVVRLIPPWVMLGIHDIGIDPAVAKIRRPSTLAIETAKVVTHTRLRSYIRRMGIDEGLLTEAFGTPFTSVRPLTRDDASRFGLDRRQFGETVWQFVDKPRPSIRKLFFVRADHGERRYIDAFVSVSCVPWRGGGAVAVLARRRLASDTEAVVGQPDASIRVNGQDIRLTRLTSAKLYLWGGQLSLKTLEATSDEAAMLLPGEELGRQQDPSGDISLAMTGFSATYAELQKVCAEQTVQAQSAQAGIGLPPLPGPLRSAPSVGEIPPLRSNQLAIGASRFAVDATLGAPTKTTAFCRAGRRPCGTIALYGYSASNSERKIIAAYFDGSGRLQHLARYVLKGGKVFDEISQTELSDGQELSLVRQLLAAPKIQAGSAGPAALPGWSPDLTGTPTINGAASSATFTPPSSRRRE